MSEESASATQQDVRYARSPLTGTWFRVTEWEDLGDGTGKMVAKSKEQVPEDEVPDVWRGAAEWRVKEGSA